MAYRFTSPCEYEAKTTFVKKNYYAVFNKGYRSSRGVIVMFLACGAKRSWVRFPVSPLRFQRWDIACVQVAVWLKDRQSDVHPQNNKHTNKGDSDWFNKLSCIGLGFASSSLMHIHS